MESRRVSFVAQIIWRNSLGKKLRIFQTYEGCWWWRKFRTTSDVLNLTKKYKKWMWINIFLGGVGLPPSMDTRGKQLQILLKCWFFNFKQHRSHIFMCNDTTGSQTHRHTETQTWIMAACFFLPVQRSQGTWGTRDSECLNWRCLKDSGTNIIIMAFPREGRWYEWLFLKQQSSDDLSKSVLMVDSHCQSACKVCVQCQSSFSCGAELLTARHLICVSKRFFWSNLHLHFVKPNVFSVSRTDLLSSLEPNQCCCPEFRFKKKGAQKVSYFSAIYTSTKKFLNRLVPALVTPGSAVFQKLGWWRQLVEATALRNEILKSHCLINRQQQQSGKQANLFWEQSITKPQRHASFTREIDGDSRSAKPSWTSSVLIDTDFFSEQFWLVMSWRIFPWLQQLESCTSVSNTCE